MLSEMKRPGRGGARHGARNARSMDRTSLFSNITKPFDFKATNLAALPALRIILSCWAPNGDTKPLQSADPRPTLRGDARLRLAQPGRSLARRAEEAPDTDGSKLRISSGLELIASEFDYEVNQTNNRDTRRWRHSRVLSNPEVCCRMPATMARREDRVAAKWRHVNGC